MNIMSIAQGAMHDQIARMHESASRVATAGDPDRKPPVDLVAETATRIEADGNFRANLSVIKAEDDRIGTLLDTFA